MLQNNKLQTLPLSIGNLEKLDVRLNKGLAILNGWEKLNIADARFLLRPQTITPQ